MFYEHSYWIEASEKDLIENMNAVNCLIMV